MWRTRPPRDKAAIQHELGQARAHQIHASTMGDFDAYQNVTEQIDDLLDELAALIPAQRDGAA